VVDKRVTRGVGLLPPLELKFFSSSLPSVHAESETGNVSWSTRTGLSSNPSPIA